MPQKRSKTRKSRRAELSERAWRLIDKLPRRSLYVFANPETKAPYDQTWFHRRWSKVVRLSGIRGPSGEAPWMHDLRRSYITICHRRGVPREVVMYRTGHSTDSAHRRYLAFADADYEKARILNEQCRKIETALDQRRSPHRSDNVAEDATRKKVVDGKEEL